MRAERVDGEAAGRVRREERVLARVATAIVVQLCTFRGLLRQHKHLALGNRVVHQAEAVGDQCAVALLQIKKGN